MEAVKSVKRGWRATKMIARSTWMFIRYRDLIFDLEDAIKGQAEEASVFFDIAEECPYCEIGGGEDRLPTIEHLCSTHRAKYEEMLGDDPFRDLFEKHGIDPDTTIGENPDRNGGDAQ